MIARRQLAVLGLVAAILSGCCDSPPPVSPAGVPTTLEQVRLRHAPPDVEVTVERKSRSRSGGGGGCGHSPVCIILLPALLLGDAFPEKWDEARIVQGEQLVYEGRFTTGGDLIAATTWDDTTVRKYDVLNLAKLGKKVVVESGSAQVVEGKHGEFTRRPILEQVDLLAEYRAKLAKTKREGSRKDLVVEAMRWLGAEAEPLARVHVGAAKEGDAVRAGILGAACKPAARWPTVPALIEEAKNEPGPKLALAALRCRGQRPPRKFEYEAWNPNRKPAPQGTLPEFGAGIDMTAFVNALVDDICTKGVESEVRLENLAGLDGDLQPLGVARASRCRTPPRRTALLVALGEEASEEELVDALKSDDPLAAQLAPQLDAARPAHRRALFLGLSVHPNRDAYLERLVAADVSPNETELVVVAGSLATVGAIGGTTRAALAVHLLHAGRSGGSDTRRAKAFLAKRARKDRKAHLLAGLLVLGEPKVAPALMRGGSRYPLPTRDARKVYSQQGLLTFSFTLIGCSKQEQVAAWTAARTDKKAIPPCVARYAAQ